MSFFGRTFQYLAGEVITEKLMKSALFHRIARGTHATVESIKTGDIPKPTFEGSSDKARQTAQRVQQKANELGDAVSEEIRNELRSLLPFSKTK